MLGQGRQTWGSLQSGLVPQCSLRSCHLELGASVSHLNGEESKARPLAPYCASTSEWPGEVFSNDTGPRVSAGHPQREPLGRAQRLEVETRENCSPCRWTAVLGDKSCTSQSKEIKGGGILPLKHLPEDMQTETSLKRVLFTHQRSNQSASSPQGVVHQYLGTPRSSQRGPEVKTIFINRLFHWLTLQLAFKEVPFVKSSSVMKKNNNHIDLKRL